MGCFKFYYALLDLKKVVIFACFNVIDYFEFEFFFGVSCQLNFFNYDFFVFLASLYKFCLFAIESCYFIFLFNWVHCC
jgi:hypothetical protein